MEEPLGDTCQMTFDVDLKQDSQAMGETAPAEEFVQTESPVAAERKTEESSNEPIQRVDTSADGTAAWGDTDSFDANDSARDTQSWKSDPSPLPDYAEEGPEMALKCPSLALKDLYRLYWESRDPVLRRSIFWKLWGQDASFLRLVAETDIFGTEEEVTGHVQHWIQRMLWRRGLHSSFHTGSWNTLTATELSHMTLKEVKWHLRRNAWHWFWCRSSPKADLPARDVFVALAMMRERQQQRVRANLANSPQPDFKPKIRDPASQGCLDLLEARRSGWMTRLFELLVYLCVAYVNHLLLIRGMHPRCTPPPPWSSPAFWVAWVLIVLARFCFEQQRQQTSMLVSSRPRSIFKRVFFWCANSSC